MSDTKPYPLGYPPEVFETIDAISFSKGKDVVILGSGSLRSQQYSADVDAFESTTISGNSRADALKNTADRFQTMIRDVLKRPLTYFMDFKCGSVEDWRVIHPDAHVSNGKVRGYDCDTARAKVDSLYEQGIITKAEHTSALELLIKNPRPTQFYEIKDKLRFNIIRWNVKEILAGHKTHRGKKVTLAECFGDPTIAKLDLIILVNNNRFIEVSNLYDLSWKGGRLNAFNMANIIQNLRDDILSYYCENNPFKMLKRMFSLARFDKKMKLADKLIPILNSDLGRLYIIISDLDTIVQMMEEDLPLPKERIKFELEQIPSRLANIWTLKQIIKAETPISKALTEGKVGKKELESIRDTLKGILADATKRELTKLKLYPPPPYFLP